MSFEAIGFSSPAFVVSLVVFTVLWTVGTPQLSRFWRHTTTFFDVPMLHPYRRARTRSIPVAMLSGVTMILDGWILVLDPPNHQNHYSPVLTIVVIVLSLVFASVLILGPTVILFNRPKRLVPPHLRDDPGYFEHRRLVAGVRTRSLPP